MRLKSITLGTKVASMLNLFLKVSTPKVLITACFTFATAKTITGDMAVASSQANSGEMETQEYAGMVINTESGITLMTKDAAYLLKGEKLEGLVGKKVTVNGKLINIFYQ